MKVVGVGCGPGMLTTEAIAIIESADQIYGSRQAIERAKEYIKKDAALHVTYDKEVLSQIFPNAVVLSTGDPLMAGLGTLPGACVTSGISSMQLAFARLGLSWDDMCCINAHATDHQAAIERVCSAVCSGYKVFIITDPKFNISTLSNALLDTNLELKIAVCEDLGYAHERISCGSVYAPPDVLSSRFCVVVWEVESKGLG
jgi:cobalt-precorrin-7 (C5)-methyltransferase